jgi:hypothetical protein
MTDRSRFIFFASHPEINTADAFNANCKRKEASSMILGCYTNNRIYVYQVENPQLSGVEEVTAAHEMLHAVWQRLDDSTKRTVGALLESAYKRVRTDELDQRMQYYEKAEPGERVNELHSIIGTEFRDLGPELEAYYSQYFLARGTVVDLHDSYKAVFDALDKKSQALKTKIEQETTSLNQAIQSYNTSVNSLNGAIATHNAAYGSLDRTNAASVAQYNQTKRQLDARGAGLAAEKQTLDERVTQYNADIATYNQTVLQSEKLSSSLDSMAQ